MASPGDQDAQRRAERAVHLALVNFSFAGFKAAHRARGAAVSDVRALAAVPRCITNRLLLGSHAAQLSCEELADRRPEWECFFASSVTVWAPG